MPNWIEGTLKLRGKSDDIKRFFDNAIQTPSTCNPDRQKRECFISCDCGQESGEWNSVSIKEDAWIEDTRRAFVNDDCYIDWENVNDDVTVCIPIRQAWDFVAENWKDISKKYNLDVRLYGFECGMEFCQEVEVIDGEITINNEIKYDDWDWECPMPRMGG